MKTSTNSPSGGPPNPLSTAPSAADDKNARLGLWLFFVYFGLYAAFMAVCAFWPLKMRDVQILGMPFFIAYGFGLILGALLLALLYMVLCHGEPADSQKGGRS